MTEAESGSRRGARSRLEVAERLRRQTPQILRRWERRARSRVAAARKQQGPVLRNSMPQFLRELADALGGPRRTARQHLLRVGFATPRVHAEQRATLPDYDLADVIGEYHVLRRVLLRTLESDGPLELDVRLFLHSCMDQAIQVAADHFMRCTQHVLADKEAFLRAVLDQMPAGVTIAEVPSGKDLYHNRESERLLGTPRIEGADPRRSSDYGALHPDDRRNAPEEYPTARALAGGEIIRGEVVRYRHPNGSLVHLSVNSGPVLDSEGRILAIVSTFVDVSGQRRIEEAQRFLAEASRILGSSLEHRVTLTRVAELAVPELADWCAVDLLEAGGAVRRLAVTHSDPERVRRLTRGRRCPPREAAAPSGVVQVVETGQPVLLAAIPEEGMEPATGLELKLAGSAVLVPLEMRERVLGVMSFVFAESRRRYQPEDVLLFEELAQRAAVAMENARLYHEVREADRRKDEFLAMLAHELRNPLAPIRNAVYSIGLRARDDPPVLHSLAIVERQVNQLVRLVDDLLDVSRITRGKIELKLQPVDLEDVLAHAIETSRPSITLRGHELSVSGPARPVRLWGDPTRVEQIIVNLINNAARYTEPGGRVIVSAEREGEEGVIRVRDTGRGIPPEMLPHVFDLFTQVSPARDREEGGLGLGLTLVRSLAELHGGSITAFSEGPGQGSEFVVRLPALPAGFEPDPAAEGRNERSGAARSFRVLVADDNRDAAETMAELLRVWGHEVTCVFDGAAALERAASFRPDVALIDIRLPDMDGCDVARRLRQSPGTARARLVAVTGFGREGDRRRSLESGFDEHLVKPLGPQDLHRLLERAGSAGSEEPGPQAG